MHVALIAGCSQRHDSHAGGQEQKVPPPPPSASLATLELNSFSFISPEKGCCFVHHHGRHVWWLPPHKGLFKEQIGKIVCGPIIYFLSEC